MIKVHPRPKFLDFVDHFELCGPGKVCVMALIRQNVLFMEFAGIVHSQNEVNRWRFLIQTMKFEKNEVLVYLPFGEVGDDSDLRSFQKRQILP